MRALILFLPVIIACGDEPPPAESDMGTAGTVVQPVDTADDSLYICEIARLCGAISDVWACVRLVEATETPEAIKTCALCYRATAELSCEGTQLQCGEVCG